MDRTTKQKLAPCPVCGALQTQATYQRHLEGHALNWRYADRRDVMPHQRRGHRIGRHWPKT